MKNLKVIFTPVLVIFIIITIAIGIFYRNSATHQVNSTPVPIPNWSILGKPPSTFSTKGEGDILLQKDIIIPTTATEITQEVQVDKSYKSLEVYLGMSYETGDINLKILTPNKVILNDQLNKDIFNHYPERWNLGTINNPMQGLWRVILYNLQPRQQNAKAYLTVTGL